MEKVTLEQTHALLEKLADYVTDRIPRIENKLTELETRLEQKADKVDLLRLAEKTDGLQKNVDRLDGKMDMILEGMDAQTQQLDIIRTDMKAHWRHAGPARTPPGRSRTAHLWLSRARQGRQI